MTKDEFNAKFDDEHQENFVAIDKLDGLGRDDHRTARLCSTITYQVLNALRLCSKEVPDDRYHDEEFYLPEHAKTPRRKPRQTWEQQKALLGF